MPTIKQKKAFNKIVENRGNISKTMLEVGYAENSARNPKNLTDSDGWMELMKTHLPDSLLAKRHKELLNKREHIAKNNNETHQIEVLDTGEPDTNAVKAGLDMAYKLKGKYAPEKKDITTQGEKIGLPDDKVAKINEIALDE